MQTAIPPPPEGKRRFVSYFYLFFIRQATIQLYKKGARMVYYVSSSILDE